MRHSGLFLTYIAVQIVLLGFAFTHAAFKRNADVKKLSYERQMVKDLGLTDLCLFTEASYTRHLSQADMNTAFQDSPMALEHFPSGSLVIPPRFSGKERHNAMSETGQRPAFSLSQNPHAN